MAQLNYLATYKSNYSGANKKPDWKKTIKVTVPTALSDVIKKNMPFWMWFDSEAKGVRLSHEQPDMSLMPHFREKVFTTTERLFNPEGTGKRVMRESGSMTSITEAISVPFGLKGGTMLSVFEDGETLLYKKATPKERSSAEKRDPAVDGRIKSGRHVRFTKSTKTLMGLGYGMDVVVKLNTKDGCWIEVMKAPPDCETPKMREALQREGLGMRDDEVDIEYRSNYAQGGLFLPSAFLKKCRAKNNEVLPFRTEGGTAIIEGMPVECSICGQMISQYKNRISNAKACAVCKPKTDEAQEMSKIAGGLTETLDKTRDMQKNLLNAIAEVRLIVEKGK